MHYVVVLSLIKRYYCSHLTLFLFSMASGGGEQSSREDCDEECRRQTICPPDPEIDD